MRVRIVSKLKELLCNARLQNLSGTVGIAVHYCTTNSLTFTVSIFIIEEGLGYRG